jgi:hypothetical protein
MSCTQVEFPQPVRLAYVEVGLEDAGSAAKNGRVFLFAKPLEAATAGRYQPLSSEATPAPLGRLHRQAAGNVLTNRLVVRGVFKSLSVRCVGAIPCDHKADASSCYAIYHSSSPSEISTHHIHVQPLLNRACAPDNHASGSTFQSDQRRIPQAGSLAT